MSLHVYVNWHVKKAKVHRSECSFCNFGAGTHPGAGDRNGEWLGSFETVEEAIQAAKQSGQPVSYCAFCISLPSDK